MSYGQHLNVVHEALAGVLRSADGVTVAGWDPPDGCEEVGGGNGDTFTSMVRSLCSLIICRDDWDPDLTVIFFQGSPRLVKPWCSKFLLSGGKEPAASLLWVLF